MPKFTRAEETVASINDREGTIIVRIFLQDPKSSMTIPLPGNFKKDIKVKGVRVTDVVKEIEAALFGGGEESDKTEGDTEIRYND